MEGNQILLKVTRFIIQLISVGDAKTGKSCIIKRYCESKFVNKYITTIGVDYGVKKVNINNKTVAVNFFDISGSPDYEEIRNPFFEHSQIVLLVFDLGNKQSFQNIGRWENSMKSNGLDLKNAVVFLLGNKVDNKVKEVESA